MVNGIIGLFKKNEEKNKQIFIIRVLSGGSEKVCNLLLQLNDNIDETKLYDFFIKILDKHIIGERLWYIYKNECNSDVNELVEKDLTSFDENYFFEKFEKFEKYLSSI